RTPGGRPSDRRRVVPARAAATGWASTLAWGGSAPGRRDAQRRRGAVRRERSRGGAGPGRARRGQSGRRVPGGRRALVARAGGAEWQAERGRGTGAAARPGEVPGGDARSGMAGIATLGAEESLD